MSYYPGIIIFVLGVAGSGKNTMMTMLAQRHPQLKQIISYKTRPLRPGEISGKDYHYVNEDVFEQKINEQFFLEYAKVHDTYYYGTSRDDVIDALKKGGIYMKEIDIQGWENIVQNHPDIVQHSVSLFLDLSEETMIKRITGRAPISQEELSQRLTSAKKERDLAKKYCTYVLSAEGSMEEEYTSVYNHIQQYLHQHTTFTL